MGLLDRLLGRPDRKRALTYVQKGYVLAAKGKVRDAVSAYERAVAADNSLAEAHLNLALARQDLFNLENKSLDSEARRERLLEIKNGFEAALGNDDTLVAGWRCLGHVARRLGEYEQSEKAFETVLDIAPSDFKHRGEAETQLRQVKEKAERARRLRALWELVQAAESDSPPGEEQVREVVTAREQDLADEEDPVAPRTFYGVAIAYSLLKEPKAAAAALTEGVRREPADLELQRELATLYVDLGEVDAALEHSLTAYKLDPTDAGLVCNLGVCYLHKGELDKAEEFLGLARELAPKGAIVQKAWAALESKRRESA